MNIGFLLMPGFRNADVVGTEAVLRFHPNNKIYYVGDSKSWIKGINQYPIKATETFLSCPQLDVLVIPELPDDTLVDEKMLHFIRRQYINCRYILGISSGVITLQGSGILKGKHVTADKGTLKLLQSDDDLLAMDRETFLKDGKIITAGPSTGAIEAAYYIMSKLRGNTLTKMLELNLEYNPTAYFDDIKQTTLPDLGNNPLKVAVITPPNLYLPDIAGALDVLTRLPNTEVYFVWKDIGTKKAILGPTLRSNTTLDECPQVDILLAGAIMPKDTVDQDLQDFYKRQVPGCKAVIGVCAGVFVAGAAGFLQDRMAVTNFHMLGMLKSVGALRHNTESIADGKFHTAGPAIGSYEVALQVVAQLYGRPTAAYLENSCLEYKPHPLFNMGTPRKAGKIRHCMSKCISAPLIPLYRPGVKKAYRKA